MLPNGRLMSGNKKADEWKIMTQNRAALSYRSCNGKAMQWHEGSLAILSEKNLLGIER